MGRKIRRVDRAIQESEAIEILRKGEYGILSTVSIDGQPYGVPVSYAYTGNVIYFHCAVEGHRVENLRGNNKVSFCVVGKTEVMPEKFGTKYESTIVFGEAFEVMKIRMQPNRWIVTEIFSELGTNRLKQVEVAKVRRQ